LFKNSCSVHYTLFLGRPVRELWDIQYMYSGGNVGREIGGMIRDFGSRDKT
jgi:hypothetical protein